MAPEPLPKPYPTYSTTFSLYRVSRLYTSLSNPLSDADLKTYAQRLRDILTGEVLRGVRVGLASDSNDALARAGTLQTITWKVLPYESGWNVERSEETSSEDLTTEPSHGRGMLITITYEKIEYKAVLLRDYFRSLDATKDEVKEEAGFEYFPLMMLKMPLSLKGTLVDFLASTFDTRISGLCLHGKFLMDTFERYLINISTASDSTTIPPIARAKVVRDVVKETIVHIGFRHPNKSDALKTIDIQIARGDLPQMLSFGQNLSKSPFFEALATYVKTHMAMDLRHERVEIVRITCGAFVLSGEGKLKVTEPSGSEEGGSSQLMANQRLFEGLIGLAKGGSLSTSSEVM